jgi:plasmid maintenance system antidote protein VapI
VSRQRSVNLEAANDIRRLYRDGEILNRELYGPRKVHHTYATLAREFGVTEQTIFNVVNYKGAYARDRQTQESEREYTTN